MAFKLKLSNTYTVDIALEIPAVGKTERKTFTIEFNRYTKDQLKEISERLGAGELTDEQWLAEVAVGWKGIVDEDGEDVPFEEKGIAAVCQIPQVPKALAAKFFESLQPVFAKN